MAYLSERPQAMDTAQGIAEWWVMRQQIRVEVETVTRVLKRLVDQGLIEKVDSPNGAMFHLMR